MILELLRHNKLHTLAYQELDCPYFAAILVAGPGVNFGAGTPTTFPNRDNEARKKKEKKHWALSSWTPGPVETMTIF